MNSSLSSLPARAEQVALSPQEYQRYSRHLIMPEVGLDGQKRLKAAKVLLIGAGGLGSPLGLYLAAAGIGRIGLVDFDAVDFSNLQRQVLHGTTDVGRPKLHSAGERLKAINPEVQLDLYETRLDRTNALRLFEPYDIIIDGTDNFATRYLVNDTCVLLKKPNVYGSIFRFDGQASVFFPGKGPCYRCLYPEPPPPGEVPSCAEGGVLGILPGVIGCIQATECIKLVLGRGEPLIGRLLLYDALQMSFREFKVRRNPKCPICGDQPTIKELIDYEQFCGVRGQEAPRPGGYGRRHHGRGAETTAGPGREGVHPGRAQPGGVSAVPDRREQAAAAAGPGGEVPRTGPGKRNGGPLQERHAQPEGDRVPARAGVPEAAEPQGRHPGLGRADRSEHAEVLICLLQLRKKKTDAPAPQGDALGYRVAPLRGGWLSPRRGATR